MPIIYKVCEGPGNKFLAVVRGCWAGWGTGELTTSPISATSLLGNSPQVIPGSGNYMWLLPCHSVVMTHVKQSFY